MGTWSIHFPSKCVQTLPTPNGAFQRGVIAAPRKLSLCTHILDWQLVWTREHGPLVHQHFSRTPFFTSHTLASCNKIKDQPHEERVDFLKSNGLCFGCLTPGHLCKLFCKFCKRRIEFKECALRHPDILHIVKREGSVLPEKRDGAHRNKVLCAPSCRVL